MRLGTIGSEDELRTKVDQYLNPVGFQLLACADLASDYKISPHKCQDENQDGESFKSVALIGNVGSSFWVSFTGSTEFQDGLPDPLDRYSKRIIDPVADGIVGAVAIYPSDGPPYAPFQTWAMRSGSYHQSPVGVLIHEGFGLWTAFRCAVLLPFQLEDIKGCITQSPCVTCVEKPCLHACPVDAFKPAKDGVGFGGYKVDACRQHVAEQKNDCYQAGCLARRACPVNSSLSYAQAQVKFHMDKLIQPLLLHLDRS